MEEDVISSICSQLGIAAERIEGLSLELERLEAGPHNVLTAYYQEMRLTELENLQRLVLELTKTIVDSGTEEEAAMHVEEQIEKEEAEE